MFASPEPAVELEIGEALQREGSRPPIARGTPGACESPEGFSARAVTFGASANSPPLKYFVNLHSTTHIAGGLKATW